MNPGYPPYPNQQQMPGQQSGPPYGVYPPQNPPSSYPNQPGFASGYQPGYPPTSGFPPAPQPGYPPQSAQSGYPAQSAYPAPQSSMPYPPQSSYPSMPSSQPSAGFSYPQSASSGYPAQSAPAAYPPQSSYPQSQPAYPQNATAPGYPAQQPYSSATYPTQQLGCQQGQTTSSHFSNLSAMNTCSPHAQPNYGKNNAYTQIERPTPTVVPAASFNARADAEILRKAMKGLGTDEKAIISVVTKRSNSQRLEIANQFKALYGKDLIADLKSELSGKFEDLILALMTPLPEFLAKEVQHAIEGIGTNEETLVEILCTASNAQIYAIKDAYQRIFYRSMENDLSSDTSGHFKRLLISVVQGRRAENIQVDEAAVAKDARDLLAAGKLQIGTDESTFNAILCTRSYPHLRRVITEYQRVSGHTLEQAIKDEFSGDIKAGLLAIVHSAENKADFFAERLRDSVACMGTKDRQLIRIVVSRCEIDMQEIKRAYQARYQKSLEQAISDDVSGDYKKALLSLIGGY